MSEVKITIEGEGLSLTKNTTLQKAGQIISFLGYEQGPMGVDSTPVIQPGLLSRRSQPRDIIFSSNAKTYPQKIAALAKYLRDQLGQNTFSPQELKVLFKKMGDEPKNFTRDFNKTLELQYIFCVDSSKEQYELTDTGDGAVQEGFTGDVIKKSSGSKKSTMFKGIREEIKNLNIVGDLSGYPDYHNMPTKGDRILWLLEYTYKNDIKSLAPVEVEFLSVKLRDKIEMSGFTALNTRNIKKNFVIKASDGFQIQKKGSDHLKSLDKPNN